MLYVKCLFIAAGAIEVKGDEYWDYDKQVDLEAFNSKQLYDILSKQSRETTQELAKQKDEVHIELFYYVCC